MIQTISDIGQENSYAQAENHLDYLIRENRLPNMTRHEWVIKYQAKNMERLHIFVSQQSRWHIVIKAEWEGLRQTNSPCDISTRFARYFQLNLD